MFPLRDDNRDRKSFPLVTVILIALNIFVFAVLQGMGNNADFTYAWSTVPEEILTGKDVVTKDHVVHAQTDDGQEAEFVAPGLRPTPISVYLTLLTSMFMHGSLGHIFGNMWFLWIFGDNIENDLGKLGYTAFYLASGLLAGLAHVFGTFAMEGLGGPGMFTPCLGASGAISGVMGAYLVLHPMRRVTVMIFRFLMDVPGYVAVGMWFGMQVLLSFVQSSGGVAYGAHIGGFIAGAALVIPVWLLRQGKPTDIGGYRVEERDWSEDNRRY